MNRTGAIHRFTHKRARSEITPFSYHKLLDQFKTISSNFIHKEE